MDCDALGRPFCDALHPYRRLRRIDRVVTPTGTSSRGVCRDRARVPARTACLSGRKEFSASSRRRGCGCRTGRIFAPARRCRLRIVQRGRGGPPISQAGLYPANCRLLDDGEAANSGAETAKLRFWCWRSSPRTIRWNRGWSARSNAARISAGRFRRTRRRRAPTLG